MDEVAYVNLITHHVDGNEDIYEVQHYMDKKIITEQVKLLLRLRI
jgi:hypothetical protein